MNWNLQNIDGIIFDMDGVIFDTESLGLRSWQALADKYNLGDIRQNAMKCIGRSTTDTIKILEECYGNIVSVNNLYNECRVLFQKFIKEEGMPLKPGAAELLSFLKENGVKVGLASSTSYKTVVSQLTDAGLISYFQVIVGGDMIENSKPKPDIYLLACKKLDVRPEKTVSVEDSLNGIKSAYSAGMIPVMVPDLIKPDDKIRSMTNDVMDSLLDVLAYIKN